jgi:hypothetical protein
MAGIPGFPKKIRDKRFERCKTQLLAWVTQGSLSQSSQGNWRWTRKVKAETVTVALSDNRPNFIVEPLRHRKLEKLIGQVRALSQQVLLNSVEGPAHRKREYHPYGTTQQERAAEFPRNQGKEVLARKVESPWGNQHAK